MYGGVFMKKDRIINPDICRSVAKLGHTEFLVIGDAGLPIPVGCEVVDVSVAKGVPSFFDVFDAVTDELVIESFIFASEAIENNSAFISHIKEKLAGKPSKSVAHQEFKDLMKNAKTVIRTGECSSYANIILVGGVNFDLKEGR